MTSSRRRAANRADGRCRVLVVTVAHRGDDARIAHRQIRSLVEWGHRVRYIAPPPDEGLDGVDRTVVRRAVGRRRVPSWLQVYREVRRCRSEVDIVLVHDLEAVLPVRLARPGVPVVWDVHEDIPASVSDREWIPLRLRGAARRLAGWVESVARHRLPLILAEHSYRDRLGEWPVVPNTTVVPSQPRTFDRTGGARAVYLGRISRRRGLATMMGVADALRDEIEVVLIGPADAEVEAELVDAVGAGRLRWVGPVSNPEALDLLDGALAGLCFLDPIPNYVGSMPTKIYEYFSRGVPAVVSGPPLAVAAVNDSGGGIVVEHDVDHVVRALRELSGSPERRAAAGLAAHGWVHARHNWTLDGKDFARHVGALAAGGRA